MNMGCSKFKIKKYARKLSVVSIVITVSVISMSLFYPPTTELLVLGSPFHYSDISKYTSLFSTVLQPQCDNFTEYNEDSRNYWQYYGSKHHMALNEHSLSNILKVTDSQKDEISRLHDELLNKYLSPNYKLYANLKSVVDRNSLDDNKGIVYVSGKSYYWLTILSIKYIRDHLNDKHTGIEIFVPIRDKGDNYCNKIQQVYPKVKCSYFTDYLSTNQVKQLAGYQYKSLALLLTTFNDILYLDSDNIPLVSLDTMLQNPNYQKTGFVSWPDFWKRSTNYKFYEMAGLSGFSNPISTTPSVESGQILINKQHHLKTLLLSYYYNFYGPGYFYPLFSQGFPGEGDKETFYLASRVANEKAFLITGQKTKSFGFKDKNGKYAGQGILQADPNNSKSYWFLHMNYPKLNINQMLGDGYFRNENKRHWTTVRNAENDGKTVEFRKSLGSDLELEIWALMDEILSKDFKGFRVFEEIGNDEMADYVKEYLSMLRNTNLDV